MVSRAYKFIGACSMLRCGAALSVARSTMDCTAFTKTLKLGPFNTTLVSATYYASGTYEADGLTNNVNFCEINATIEYAANDDMNFLTWLPDSFSGRFLPVGNGGFAGSVDTGGMLTNLNLGYGFAVAGGDGGHLAAPNTVTAPGQYIPFFHDPAQVQAWIHKGISTFTPVAKYIVKTKYSHITHSYYDGCSTGGAQGFALAQYWPDLYDGIVAGSPGNWYSHLMLSFLYNEQQTANPSSFITPAQLVAMTAATVNACNGQNGVNDGVIENPLACKFNINSFSCTSVPPTLNSTLCLTPAQLNAAKAIYTGPKRIDNGQEIYPGFAFGSESSWSYQEGPLATLFAIPLLQNLVFDNLNYDANTFNYASDVDTVNRNAGAFIDELSTDLHAYQRRGGKMIVTQGWADQLNSPYWPIQHLDQIQQAFGGSISSWYELFMVPGAGHCGANPLYVYTPGTYLTVPALVSWVERGIRPVAIESTTPLDGSNTTRKLCPWPQTSHYVGGDSTQWTSFQCK